MSSLTSRLVLKGSRSLTFKGYQEEGKDGNGFSPREKEEDEEDEEDEETYVKIKLLLTES